ncbi:MAG: hypothetical protein WCF57_19075 [Pyrinomonadaceae bacterium]
MSLSFRGKSLIEEDAGQISKKKKGEDGKGRKLKRAKTGNETGHIHSVNLHVSDGVLEAITAALFTQIGGYAWRRTELPKSSSSKPGL